jgi:Activator of Hsp90 ATPase homolog 1-like protein
MPENTTTVFAEPGKQEILITREFDAPRELVFKVCMDPQLLSEWWGPRYLTTEVDKMDVRPGGQWRFINRDAQGNTYAFHGVYHEIRVRGLTRSRPCHARDNETGGASRRQNKIDRPICLPNRR